MCSVVEIKADVAEYSDDPGIAAAPR